MRLSYTANLFVGQLRFMQLMAAFYAAQAHVAIYMYLKALLEKDTIQKDLEDLRSK